MHVYNEFFNYYRSIEVTELQRILHALGFKISEESLKRITGAV